MIYPETELRLGDRSFRVPALTLGRLIEAAEHIEAAASFLHRAGGRLSGLLQACAPILSVAAIGLADTSTPIAADALCNLAGADDVLAIVRFHADLLDASGLTKSGEDDEDSGPRLGGAAVQKAREPLRDQILTISADLALAGIMGGDERRIWRELTLHDARRYWDRWSQNGPPMYISLAASIGWKPKPKQDADAKFDELVKMLGGGFAG